MFFNYQSLMRLKIEIPCKANKSNCQRPSQDSEPHGNYKISHVHDVLGQRGVMYYAQLNT